MSSCIVHYPNCYNCTDRIVSPVGCKQVRCLIAAELQVGSMVKRLIEAFVSGVIWYCTSCEEAAERVRDGGGGWGGNIFGVKVCML